MVSLLTDEKHQGGRFFFKAVKEGDQVIFASEEDMDRQTWVYKLYNATGQSFKPSAPKLVMPATASTNSLARAKGGKIGFHAKSMCVSTQICGLTCAHWCAARGSKQKFDNDYDVIFMCYKCNIT